MAQHLPFSIENILRADFPHPSRISKRPRVLYTVPLRGREKVPFVALRCQLDYRLNRGETRHPVSRENYYPQLKAVVVCPENDKTQTASCDKEQEKKLVREDSNEEKTVCGKKADESKQDEKTAQETSVAKKKRNRSHFSQIQLKYLEDVFSRQQYLTRDERSLLANALDMTELQIRNWFQNRRYQLRHRGLNRPRQVPVKVLVSSEDCKETRTT